MRIVAALGGNALLERGEPPESDIQEAHVVTAVRSAGPLIAVPDDDACGRSHELAAFG